MYFTKLLTEENSMVTSGNQCLQSRKKQSNQMFHISPSPYAAVHAWHFYCEKVSPVLAPSTTRGGLNRVLVERSEFLIDISHKKSLRVCPCAACTCQIILVLVLKNCLGFSVGYQRKKKRTPGTSERFVANCGVGPSTRGQGDSASLVQRR